MTGLSRKGRPCCFVDQDKLCLRNIILCGILISKGKIISEVWICERPYSCERFNSVF